MEEYQTTMVNWSKTRNALAKLMSLFTCTKCENTLQEPCSFQMCDHYFCRNCATKLIDDASNCPECDAVLWKEHLQVSLKIPEVMGICKQINYLISDRSESAEENSEECHTYNFNYMHSGRNKLESCSLRDSIPLMEIEDDSNKDNVLGDDSEINADDKETKNSNCLSEDHAISITKAHPVRCDIDAVNEIVADDCGTINMLNKEISTGHNVNSGLEDDKEIPTTLTSERGNSCGGSLDSDSPQFHNHKGIMPNKCENVDGSKDMSKSKINANDFDNDSDLITLAQHDRWESYDISFNDSEVMPIGEKNEVIRNLVSGIVDTKGQPVVSCDSEALINFQISQTTQAKPFTSVKGKGNSFDKSKKLPGNNLTDDDLSPERSQFSKAVSDKDFNDGVQRNPKCLTKKPKITYTKKMKRASDECILKNSNASRDNFRQEDNSIFDFCSGTITKSITFERDDDFSNKGKTLLKKNACVKRKRVEIRKENVGKDSKEKQKRKACDLEKRNKKGETALCAASIKENFEQPLAVENYSKEKQKRKTSNIEKRNKKGETALHTACIKGHFERAKELLELGAQPNTRDFNGWTPLHEACNHGHVNIVQLLLDYNAIIDCVAGEDNDTPLHDAVSNNRIEVCKLLLERGAPANIKNRIGLLPADYAPNNAMKKLFKEIMVFEACDSSYNNELNVSSLSLNAPYVILTTNLKKCEINEVNKCCDILGGTLLHNFDSSVTHVVCGTVEDSLSVSRTMKYLMGVLMGKWMISFDWISESLKKEKWEIEANYEIIGLPGESKEAPKRARLNHFKTLPKLFEGCSFYFSGSFHCSVSKETLVNLVKMGGGKILYREPKANIDDPLITPVSSELNKFKLVPKITAPSIIYHAKENSAQVCCQEYIIYDPDMNPTHSRISSPILCSAPVSWLFDCISNFQILDVHYEKKEGFNLSQS